MLKKGDPVGRVCPYAAQQCGMESGCLTFDRDVFGVDLVNLELRARGCAARGVHLYAAEIRTALAIEVDGGDEHRNTVAAARGRRLAREIDTRPPVRPELGLRRRVAPSRSE